MLVAYSNIFAFLTQSNWRWRNDDGTETTATWLAAENTTPTITSGENTIRLRLEVYNTLSDTTYLEDTLQYATSASGPWTNITPTAGSAAFVLAGTSAYVTDDEGTTNQLSSSVNKPYHAGVINVSHEVLNDSLPPDERSEYEWCIKPTANIQTNTTYYFQHWGATAQKKSTATYPSLTTAGVLSIKLVNFTVKPDGKQVKVEWTTASEQNNDRFDIERSTDSRIWKTIATIKGNGTTTQTNNYHVFDNLPVKGMNYYRIKQYDLNGKSFISDIRSLKMFLENNSLLSAYPNPAKSVINFTLQSYSGMNVIATLRNSDGKIIHQETIKEIQANAKYTLNIKQHPAPGIYVLQLKAEGLSETIKVVVQ
jgi:Secretion system C-terminal sorting domain